MKQGSGLAKGAAAMRHARAFLAIGAAAFFAWSVVQCCLLNRGFVLAQTRFDLAAITVDYPEDGSIFPPEITPPTFAGNALPIPRTSPSHR